MAETKTTKKEYIDEDGYIIIQNWEDVPNFLNEEEESRFWSQHSLDSTSFEHASDRPLHLPVARSRKKVPVSLLFQQKQLDRLNEVAYRKGIDVKVLMQIFILDQLHEEEKQNQKYEIIQDSLSEIQSNNNVLELKTHQDDVKNHDGHEENGILDFLTNFTQDGQSSIDFLNNFSESLKFLNSNIIIRTSKIKNLNKLKGKGQKTISLIKTQVDAVTDDMNAFSDENETGIDEFEKNIFKMKESLKGLMTWLKNSQGIEANQLHDSLKAIESFEPSLIQFNENFEGFIKEIERLRDKNISKNLNAACSRMISLIQKMVGSVQLFDSNNSETVEELKKAI